MNSLSKKNVSHRKRRVIKAPVRGLTHGHHGHAPRYYSKKKEKRTAEKKFKKDLKRVEKSRREYEAYLPDQKVNNIKEAAREMLDIVETLSEKMTNNQYLKMMNHLQTIHKSEDRTTRNRTRNSFEDYFDDLDRNIYIDYHTGPTTLYRIPVRVRR